MNAGLCYLCNELKRNAANLCPRKDKEVIVHVSNNAHAFVHCCDEFV